MGSRGTEGALELASANDARFVLASTSEIYGDPAVHPQKESYWGNVNSIGPRSVYDEAKRYAEAASMAYQRSPGRTSGSCESSTPTGRSCGRTTAAWYRRSSPKPCWVIR